MCTSPLKVMETDDLTLDFWVETPSGKSREMAKVALKNLPIGKESRLSLIHI